MGPKWIRSNGTNLGLFKIRSVFSKFCFAEPNTPLPSLKSHWIKLVMYGMRSVRRDQELGRTKVDTVA